MWISRLDRLGMGALRFGLIVVLLWIGALKFASYEADSIVPLVANSPALRVLYRFPSPAYRQYMIGKVNSFPPIEPGTNPTEPTQFQTGSE